MILGDVLVRLRGLIRFKQEVDRSDNPHIRTALKQWAARYRGAMQQRFVRFSRGGGNWPPLKYKRKRGARESAAILRDTNTMFAALSPAFTGAPGQFEDIGPMQVRVGYGGPGTYPDGSASVADIAEFHQVGAGNLPVRETIVEPPQATMRGMADDMQRAMKRIADDTVNS